ncbi:MAG: hypothetical protein NTY91_05785 [Euryarchaeota archaeon]|jgi:hypothetical protein|nr:hypothetical protein [Euryarchaeota archaeon]
MRKTLIGGSLLVVLLLLMLPAVTAEQVKIAQSATITSLNIETTYLEVIRQKYKDNPSPQIIFITLAILLLKLLRWGIIIIGGIFVLAILRIIRNPNNNTSAIL